MAEEVRMEFITSKVYKKILTPELFREIERVNIKCTRHDSYSHAINRRISAIENQYHSDLQAGILSPEEARQEARQEIRKLQNRLRKVLDRDSKTNEPRRVGYKKI